MLCTYIRRHAHTYYMLRAPITSLDKHNKTHTQSLHHVYVPTLTTTHSQTNCAFLHAHEAQIVRTQKHLSGKVSLNLI